MMPENAIFLSKDVKELLQNKTVVVLGDSIQRSVYKDLVCLWKQGNSRYLHEGELRRKGEREFLGDKLLLGGQLLKKVNGVEYREVREFNEGGTICRFYFVTRCYSEYIDSVLNEMKTLKPHALIMNSCYWDIHRYGEQGKYQYKTNLEKLVKAIHLLPSKPLFIWNSALPLAEYCKGGFLRQGFKTLPKEDVVTANSKAREVMEKYSCIYLDLYNSLISNSIFEQAEDGIHWGWRAHRKMSNSILTVISKSWDKPIPTLAPKPHPETELQSQYTDANWPYYSEINNDGDDYDEDYEDEFDFWEQTIMNQNQQPFSPMWDVRAPGPNFQPTPLHASFRAPPSNLGQFGYSIPQPWERDFSISPNDRYLEWSQSRVIPPLMSGQVTPVNIGLPIWYPRYFSDPLPSSSFSIGYLNSPQLPNYQSDYRNRFPKMKGSNARGRNRRKNTKITSSASTPLSRQQNGVPPKGLESTPRNALAGNHQVAVKATEGAIPTTTCLADSMPVCNEVLSPQVESKISDPNNNMDVKCSSTCDKTNTLAMAEGKSKELCNKDGNAESHVHKDASNNVHLKSTVSSEVSTGGKKRKRDEDDEQPGEDSQPAKQAKADLDSSIKCTLHYDTFF